MTLQASPASAKKSQEGRPEALIFATTFGLYEGIALSILLDENDIVDGDPALYASLTLVTTFGSFAGAWYLTERYGVNEADASLVNSSLFWSVLNGAALGVGIDTDAEGMIWSTLVSGWLGQGLGILLAANADRSAGEVGLMNTTATWTGAEVTLWLGVFGVERGSTYFTVGTGLADLSLLAGAWLYRDTGVSQTRARLLDLGALAGGLAGPAALFMVWGPEENLREWYLSAVAVGIPIGIATAWYLTRNFDDEEPGEAKGTLMLPLAYGAF